MRILGADMFSKRLAGLLSKKRNNDVSDKARRPVETASLPIPVVEAKNREALYGRAKKYIESRKIGEVERYKRPLTKQIRSDMRLLHPALAPFFDEADRTSRRIFWTAMAMRFVTLLMFLGFVSCAIGALSWMASKSHPEAPADFLTEDAVWVWLFAIIAFAALLIRHTFIGAMKTKAGDFGGAFNGNLQLLNNKASFALERVSDDEPTTEGCEQRAEEWTSVALWLFDLYAVYDRYVTTRSWGVQTGLEYITWGFRLAKWLALIAAGVFFYVGDAFSEGYSLPGVAAVLVLFLCGVLFIWDVLPGAGARNSLFSDSFISSIAGRNPEEVFENHVNTKTARLVKKLRGLYYNALKAH